MDMETEDKQMKTVSDREYWCKHCQWMAEVSDQQPVPMPHIEPLSYTCKAGCGIIGEDAVVRDKWGLFHAVNDSDETICWHEVSIIAEEAP